MPRRKVKRKAFQPPKTKTEATKTEATKTETKAEVDGCSETITPVTTLTTEGDLELPSKVRMRLSNVQSSDTSGR